MTSRAATSMTQWYAGAVARRPRLHRLRGVYLEATRRLLMLPEVQSLLTGSARGSEVNALSRAQKAAFVCTVVCGTALLAAGYAFSC